MLIMKYHMIAQNLTDLLYISPFRNGSYDKECELQYMYSPFSFNLHFLHFCYTRRSKLESLINIQHNKYAFIIFSTNLSLYYSIIFLNPVIRIEIECTVYGLIAGKSRFGNFSDFYRILIFVFCYY